MGHYIAKLTGSFLLGVIAGGVVGGLLGILMERGFLQRLYKREMDQVLLTIGFVYVLTNVTQWIWGPVPKSGIVPEILAGSVHIGIVDIPIFRLSVIGIGILALIGLWLFQEKTRIGAAIRAGMDNKESMLGTFVEADQILWGLEHGVDRSELEATFGQATVERLANLRELSRPMREAPYVLSEGDEQ